MTDQTDNVIHLDFEAIAPEAKPEPWTLSPFPYQPGMTGVGANRVVILTDSEKRTGFYLSILDATKFGVDLIKTAAEAEIMSDVADDDS